MKRVLVISHNVFSKISNMGKTLSSYFREFSDCDIAQFYIHSEVPTDNICGNYYRITDTEALKSIFTRRSGIVFGENDIEWNADTSRTDTGVKAQLYQKARKRTPLIYIARNVWWQLGKWNTEKLRMWLDDFNPDIVFFASGDYGFMYKIARTIAESRKIPLVVCCMDDYYLFNKNEGSCLGRWSHRWFMKQVKKTMAYTSSVLTICEKMAMDYQKMFDKPHYTLHTPSTLKAPLKHGEGEAISYIGNLGYNRHKQLIDLGRALKNLSVGEQPVYIDVYSAEGREEILKDMTEENGIRFHGSISADQVLEVMEKSIAVIHTESFDESTRKSVAYSVSTKIADSLASGTCILAYGPAEVASIHYLRENNAAFCITDPEMLQEGLSEFLADASAREAIISNALELAEKNHNQEKNCRLIYDALKEACGK